MKIANPAVTLDDDARIGVKENVRNGFLDWLHSFSVTGGRGALSVRQWHAYPNILLRELFTDEQKSGEKFDTL